MKARKRTILQCVKFDSMTSVPHELRSNIHEENGQYKVWNGLHGSFINFKLGDYIATEMKNDMYPIEGSVFAKTYDIICQCGPEDHCTECWVSSED